MTGFAAFARSSLLAALAAATIVSAPAPAQVGRGGEDRRILIENRSSQAILYVRGSPVTQPDFGPDRIPERVIATGERAVVDFDSGTRDCMYDLRVTMIDGSNIDRMNVNVCRVSRWTVGDRSNELR